MCPYNTHFWYRCSLHIGVTVTAYSSRTFLALTTAPYVGISQSCNCYECPWLLQSVPHGLCFCSRVTCTRVEPSSKTFNSSTKIQRSSILIISYMSNNSKRCLILLCFIVYFTARDDRVNTTYKRLKNTYTKLRKS